MKHVYAQMVLIKLKRQHLAQKFTNLTQKAISALDKLSTYAQFYQHKLQ
jgi:hypothetical protein